MPIGTSTGYYTSPYAQYNSYKPPVTAVADQRENEEDQLAAASGSIAAAVQQPVQPVNNGNQPQMRTVEAESEAEGSRQESMDRKNSSVQMDMLDLQAAFFGFSMRRPSDIPAVTLEPAVS